MSTATFNPTKDADFQQGFPTTDDSAGPNVNVGVSSGKTAQVLRGAWGFDISTLPAGSVISACTLTLQCSSVNGVASQACHVYRITQAAWLESSDWNQYDIAGNHNWTTAGGDFTTVGGVAFTGPAAAGSFVISGLDVLAQDAFDSRAGKLLLIIVNDAETVGVTAHTQVYDSKEKVGGTQAVLTVTYTAGGARRRIFVI